MSEFTLRVGDSGEFVAELNAMLKALKYAVNNTLSFDNKTQNAVYTFQNDFGLPPTGIIDENCWNVLKDAAKKAVPEEMEQPEQSEQSAMQVRASRPTLRQGDRGTYVVELQTMLKKLGYLSGAADGIFGSNTAAAVRAFQAANGLTADGVVGAKTWAALDKAVAPPAPPTPPTPPSTQRPTLRVGSTGQDVLYLQGALKLLGYYTGPLDGSFGSGTADAVKRFQLSRGLTADGVVGARTWDAITQALIGIPPTGTKPTLREGNTGDYVKVLQKRLKDFGYYTGPIDGVFGRTTTEAVKKFQTAAKVTADGIVGPQTWSLLDTLLPPVQRPTLKEGDTGEGVIILQDKLKNKGYFSGSITGSFGPETTSAVKTFQRDNGLPVTGIVDTSTWDALYRIETEQPGIPPGERPTLRLGDSGPYVELLQNELSTLMYYRGKITGKFDSATEVAVKAFQDANKLTPDGVVGRFTWYALIALYPPPVNCL